MKVRIYHNPRCSKSRSTLGLLQQRKMDIEIVDYLQSPPSRQRLEEIISMLQISPRDLIRKTEPEYKTLNLYREDIGDDILLDAMLTHPILIERPIVIRGNSARIGRPPEAVLEIL